MTDDEMRRVLKGARKKLARGVYPRSARTEILDYLIDHSLYGVGAKDVLGACHSVIADAYHLKLSRKQETT